MFIFPDNLIPALFQHPCTRRTIYSTQVVTFVGGTEQRYALAGAPLRTWQAGPRLLSDKTVEQLAAFFDLVKGPTNPFRFRDPWEDVTYPVCFFQDDGLEIAAREQDRNAVSFAIVEGKA